MYQILVTWWEMVTTAWAIAHPDIMLAEALRGPGLSIGALLCSYGPDSFCGALIRSAGPYSVLRGPTSSCGATIRLAGS